MYVGFFAQDKDSFAAQDRWNIDLSYEHWQEKPNGLEQKPYSFGFGLNRMFDFSISRNHSFAFGLGMHWLNHYNNGSFQHIVSPRELVKDTIAIIPSGVSYSVNKYVLHFIDFNTELRLRIGHARRVKFYLGFRGSYLLGSHSKFKDGSIKVKQFKREGFEKINYGPTVRLGFDNVSLYACYWLVPVYKNEVKQEISSFSVGLTFFLL